MSVGLHVWIGVRPDRVATDEDYCDGRTLAHTEELCRDQIIALGLQARLVPMCKMLILKGRMA